MFASILACTKEYEFLRDRFRERMRRYRALSCLYCLRFIDPEVILTCLAMCNLISYLPGMLPFIFDQWTAADWAAIALGKDCICENFAKCLYGKEYDEDNDAFIAWDCCQGDFFLNINPPGDPFQALLDCLHDAYKDIYI
jgi:hypothetical protein